MSVPTTRTARGIPEDWNDISTFEIFEEPIDVHCQPHVHHTFEKSTIESWCADQKKNMAKMFQEKKIKEFDPDTFQPTCPNDNLPIDPARFTANTDLKNKIAAQKLGYTDDRTFEIMKDPVRFECEDGHHHVFDKKSITAFVDEAISAAKEPKCPVDGKKTIDLSQCVPDPELKEKIQNWCKANHIDNGGDEEKTFFQSIGDFFKNCWDWLLSFFYDPSV